MITLGWRLVFIVTLRGGIVTRFVSGRLLGRIVKGLWKRRPIEVWRRRATPQVGGSLGGRRR